MGFYSYCLTPASSPVSAESISIHPLLKHFIICLLKNRTSPHDCYVKTSLTLLPCQALYLLLEVQESQGHSHHEHKLRHYTHNVSVLAPLTPYTFLEKKLAAGARTSQPTAGSVPHLTLNYLNSSWLLMISGCERSSLDRLSPPGFTCCNLLHPPHPSYTWTLTRGWESKGSGPETGAVS